MAKLPNVHPGEVLIEEFLKPFGVSMYRLAKSIDVPLPRISMIVRQKRSITPDTALRLAKFFGTTAEFWINLQTAYDLEERQRALRRELDRIPIFQESAAI